MRALKVISQLHSVDVQQQLHIWFTNGLKSNLQCQIFQLEHPPKTQLAYTVLKFGHNTFKYLARPGESATNIDSYQVYTKWIRRFVALTHCDSGTVCKA